MPSYRWLVPAALALSCGCTGEPGPPVATAALSLSRSWAEPGSPVDVTYRFEALPTVSRPSGDQTVYVHVVDPTGLTVWDDDHVPPVAPAAWQPGQPVQYTRTMFVPRVVEAACLRFLVGLYSPTTGRRASVALDALTDGAAPVACLDVRARPDAVPVSFGAGWYAPEFGALPSRQWRWSLRSGHLVSPNPKAPATLWLELDGLAGVSNQPVVAVLVNGHAVDEFPLNPRAVLVHATHLSQTVMGDGVALDIEVRASQTFVPATVAALDSSDTRELGVRVFNAYLAVP